MKLVERKDEGDREEDLEGDEDEGPRSKSCRMYHMEEEVMDPKEKTENVGKWRRSVEARKGPSSVCEEWEHKWHNATEVDRNIELEK